MVSQSELLLLRGPRAIFNNFIQKIFQKSLFWNNKNDETIYHCEQKQFAAALCPQSFYKKRLYTQCVISTFSAKLLTRVTRVTRVTIVICVTRLV
jgi:hypothetical protein